MAVARKLGISLERYIVGDRLAGVKNGVNKLFTTAYEYVEGTISLYYNGVCQVEGVDYWQRETGGAGAGFDAIEFIDRAPLSDDEITASYIAVR